MEPPPEPGGEDPTNHDQDTGVPDQPEPRLLFDFTYITSEYLRSHWGDELGCSVLQGEDRCEYKGLDAVSYEEAVWMIENGYPTASMLREFEALTDRELLSLAMQDNALARQILSDRFAARGDHERAERFSHRSRVASLNPYILQRRAWSLITHPDPEMPGWSYRAAATDLKMASLLGDYEAELDLYELIDSYWDGRPHMAIVSDIHDSAYLYLSRRFGLPIDDWPVTHRPRKNYSSG